MTDIIAKLEGLKKPLTDLRSKEAVHNAAIAVCIQVVREHLGGGEADRAEVVRVLAKGLHPSGSICHTDEELAERQADALQSHGYHIVKTTESEGGE